MKWKIKILVLAIVGLCTSMMIFFSEWSQSLNNHLKYLLLWDTRLGIQSCFTGDCGTAISEKNNIRNDINRTVIDNRKLIANKMKHYKYPCGRYNNSTRSLADLVPDLEGIPIRNIIITTWRSGSTFFGDIFSNHPGTFYFYEPLSHYGYIQIREELLASNALQDIRHHLNCHYANLSDYLEYCKKNTWVVTHNVRLWTQCKKQPHICWLPEFLTQFCRLFPFQLMKTTRLRLQLVEELLNDSTLDVRVLLLVRDPRGTIQSRKHCHWCKEHPDCSDASNLCMDLVSDYNTAVEFTKKYSERFRAVRYEDISANTYKMTRELCAFFRLEFHPDVQHFLDTHTKTDKKGQYNTYRNSQSTPFHWRTDLEYDEVQSIQNVCMHALSNWGYNMALNETHQKQFNPIRHFSFE